MNRSRSAAVTAAAVTSPALALSGTVATAGSYSPRLDAVGLTTDHKLVTFHLHQPEDRWQAAAVKGLVGDVRLVGIDRRVQDGLLYGVGNAGGIYTLQPTNGHATKVSQLTVALSGTTFGVDFNPAADRLRIISDTGQNLRHNVNTDGTTIADTTLTYPPTTPTAAATTAAGLTGAAYTNNDLDTNTATTLYDIDTTLDQLVLQSPANSGQLSPIGKLGIDATADAGFDIYTTLRKGTATDATGYAVLTVGSSADVYQISLLTGQAHHVSTLPRTWQLTDLAIGLDRS